MAPKEQRVGWKPPTTFAARASGPALSSRAERYASLCVLLRAEGMAVMALPWWRTCTNLPPGANTGGAGGDNQG